MPENLIIDDLEESALFAEIGKPFAEVIKTVLESLEDTPKQVGGINIHLRADDNSKVEYLQFWFNR